MGMRAAVVPLLAAALQTQHYASSLQLADAGQAPTPEGSGCPTGCNFVSGRDGQDTSLCETACGPNAYCDPRPGKSTSPGECVVCS